MMYFENTLLEYLDFQYGKPEDETASGASPIRTRPKRYSG